MGAGILRPRPPAPNGFTATPPTLPIAPWEVVVPSEFAASSAYHRALDYGPLLLAQVALFCCDRLRHFTVMAFTQALCSNALPPVAHPFELALLSRRNFRSRLAALVGILELND